MTKRWLRPLRAALACLALATALPVAAEALVSLRTTSLPALDAGGAVGALASVDRTLLAFAGDDDVWRLDPDARAWATGRWQGDAAPGRVLGAFGDGTRAYLLVAGKADASDAPRAAMVERIDVAGDVLARDPLPPLPAALAGALGTVRDGIVHVTGRDAGGAERLLRIDTAADEPAWASVDAWPIVAPATSIVAQAGELLVTVDDGADTRLWRWRSSGGWQARGDVPGRVVSASSPRAVGQAHVLYLLRSGDGAKSTARAATYQTITGSWADVPGAAPPADAIAAPAGGSGLTWLASRSSGGHAATGAAFASPDLLLGWLDWTIIVVYLLGMTGIGAYFYLREKRGSTASFFVGGRSIPFWAAGVSLYATNVSSISFIAIPAKAFETNWTYLANNMIAVLGLVFVAIWIVPLLRRLDLMSVFSYLETRFHPGIRMVASALCIVMQIGSRMSIILFLPALAIASITGVDVVWSILMMGVFTIVYTTLGGMKAVIWTDFVQVFVMFGGAIFAIVFVVMQIDGGAAQALNAALAEDKTKLFDFSFDLTQATVWGFIFLVFFDVVLTFPKDQVLMQRVLSTRSDREAGRSVWTFAAIMIPGGFFFYSIGTALWVFYRDHPERMNPTLPIDATFPLFIAAELPTGVTGLIIAGIFAAAMSTLSSIINSVSTLVSVDFYEKLAKNPTPEKSVRFAEWTGVVVGLIGIGLAIVLSRFDIRSLFDVSIELVGLLGGGFAGAYTLGMFTRRANAPGVAIGIGAALVLTFVIWTFQAVHPYYYLAISIAICIVVGYVASLCFPPPRQSLEGLTILRPKRA